jgi:hypothetical protein
MISPLLVKQFWSRIKRGPGCWEWQRGRKGYGQVWLEGKKWYAHRLAYTLCRGEIPPGKSICHTCDNPRCVRPSHLWLGSQTDNMRDMGRKGRTNTQKISFAQRQKIRARYAKGDVLQKTLATEYGVANSVISAIVNYRIGSDDPRPNTKKHSPRGP